jgi:16S rRNA (adenine1518-N6/adenine1519-N6)-dimethyltransferase
LHFVNQFVRPKKHLGQHFLHDDNIARKVAGSLSGYGNYTNVLEVGPGTGALTKSLIHNPDFKWVGVEVDAESVAWLKDSFRDKNPQIIHGDFLRLDLGTCFDGDSFAVIGNFPYNISSQILFKALEFKHLIPELVGMFQKEVGMRIASKSGNKTYGILSVLTQAFYDVELLFYIGENVFIPPPKVKSVVIRMKRKEQFKLDCDERMFYQVVKAAFNQRRKMLHNALKQFHVDWEALPAVWHGKRAEQLDVSEFIQLCQHIAPATQTNTSVNI